MLAHGAAIELGRQAAAPSSTAKATKVARQQDEFPLCNRRHSENSGFDVQLFHPAFENFHQIYHGRKKLETENKSVVHELQVCSAGYCDDERIRRDAIIPILDRSKFPLRVEEQYLH